MGLGCVLLSLSSRLRSGTTRPPAERRATRRPLGRRSGRSSRPARGPLGHQSRNTTRAVHSQCSVGGRNGSHARSHRKCGRSSTLVERFLSAFARSSGSLGPPSLMSSPPPDAACRDVGGSGQVGDVMRVGLIADIQHADIDDGRNRRAHGGVSICWEVCWGQLRYFGVEVDPGVARQRPEVREQGSSGFAS